MVLHHDRLLHLRWVQSVAMLQDIVDCAAPLLAQNWYHGVFASNICLLQMSSIAEVAMSVDTCSSQ